MSTPEYPHSISAERALLGAFFARPENLLVAFDQGLRREQFFRTSHGLLFDLLTEMAERGEPIDTVTVPERVMGRGVEQYGGVQYVLSIMEEGSSAANVVHYVAIVQERWQRRESIRRVQERIEQLRDTGRDNVTRTLNAIVDDVAGVSLRPNGKWRAMADIVNEETTAAAVPAEDRDQRRMLASGFPDLYLSAGELVVLAARPSMGKTALAMAIGRNVAAGDRSNGHAPIPVGVFSLEMRSGDLIQRMLAAEAELHLERIRHGRLSDGDLTTLRMYARDIEQLPIHIDDQPGLTIGEIKVRTRRLMQITEGRLGLVVVDYLQLISSSGSAGNREREVAEISAGLKALAKDLDIPVMALSQLSRACEERRDKRPMLSDLRESGAIEQDADQAWFLFRGEHYWPEDITFMRKAEVLRLKHRNGALGTTHLVFKGEFCKFQEPARGQQPMFTGNSK